MAYPYSEPDPITREQAVDLLDGLYDLSGTDNVLDAEEQLSWDDIAEVFFYRSFPSTSGRRFHHS